MFMTLNLRDIPRTECLFCGLYFSTADECLIHMMKKHDFRIPDMNYLISLDDFMDYIYSKGTLLPKKV